MNVVPEETSTVETAVEGRVLVIWLNRPEARNAIDGATARASSGRSTASRRTRSSGSA